MRPIDRMVGAGFLALVAGAGAVAGTAQGCASGGETSAGGAGGATLVGNAGAGGLTTCPPVDDAGPDAYGLGPVPATPADVSLCTDLASQQAACNPGCPMEPPDTCAYSWACARTIVRQDMIADLYRCMPTVPCSEEQTSFADCAASLRAKYPPSAAQLAYEAAVAQNVMECAPGDPSPCTGGLCGGFTDAIYTSLTQCYMGGPDDCLGAAICVYVILDLEVNGTCGVLAELVDGGAGGGGTGGGAGAGGGGDGG